MKETLGTSLIRGFIVSYDVRTVKYISSEERSSSSNYFLDNDIGMDGWADMIYLPFCGTYTFFYVTVVFP